MFLISAHGHVKRLNIGLGTAMNIDVVLETIRRLQQVASVPNSIAVVDEMM
jgi:hypothetical protein